MTLYGKIAVASARVLATGPEQHPEAVWRLVAHAFTSSESVRNKGCPRKAFVSLCNAGMVRGVNSSPCEHQHSKNGQYTLEAARLIWLDPTNAANKARLWGLVAPGIKANCQLDVLFGLHESRLLRY